MKNIYIGKELHPTFPYANLDTEPEDIDMDLDLEEVADKTVNGIPVTKDGFRVVGGGGMMEPPDSNGKFNILSFDDDGYWVRVWSDYDGKDECRLFIPTC